MLNIPFKNDLLHIIKNMRYNGQYPRLVGGCVRDMLLKKTINDIDIATPAPPEIIIKQIHSIQGQAIPTGLQHGTVTGIFYTKTKQKITIEFTTLRVDLECDGRYAKIAFTNNFKEDARRRDLTINAMSYCMITNTLFDYFNGEKDLHNNIINFIDNPTLRIQEDYLRILRFFRFTAYYGYKNNKLCMDSASYQACLDLAHNSKILSQERITHEILKLIIAPYGIAVLKSMSDILKYYNLSKIDIELFTKYKKNPNIDIALSLLFYNHYNELLKFKLSKKLLNNIKVIQSIIKINNQSQKTFELKKLAIKKHTSYLNICNILHQFTQLSNTEKLFLDTFYNTNHIFPISGHDIIKKGYSKKDIGIKISELEIKWINSNCTISKKDLLDLI